MNKNIIVIGAGLAGTLICNELVKQCNVILLEVGEKNAISYPKINFIQKRFAWPVAEQLIAGITA